MALDTTLLMSVNATLSTALDLGVSSAALNKAYPLNLPTGTSSGQADKIFHDQRTLAASGTEDLDLAGVLTDPFGAALTFAKLKAVLIKAADGNTNNVVLSRPASNGVPLFSAASDAIPILPGGLFLWVGPGAGVTVTAGTGDLLTITNSAGGTGVTYDVVLIGTSA